MLKRTFDEDLAMAVAYHGHLCAGQVLGTRIARIGLAHFGIDEPETYRDLIAFVEADRCLADAVCSVAKCNIGRRRLKWFDYGKMAATFYDINTDSAVRVCSIGQAKPGPNEDTVEFFSRFADDEFFSVEDVVVNIDEYDLPGRPKAHVTCDTCGEHVLDNRHLVRDGLVLCKACAGLPLYYRKSAAKCEVG
ncbi:MAG: formylmethanofuran dehydrogenase [Coriobacteriia bacterium]|nr:formylmethanofuran dehydrogenase [Coriobacteriia bacterium]